MTLFFLSLSLCDKPAEEYVIWQSTCHLKKKNHFFRDNSEELISPLTTHPFDLKMKIVPRHHKLCLFFSYLVSHTLNCILTNIKHSVCGLM